MLTQAARTNDFAIIILTADDVTVSRDVAAPAPRDNLIVEFGWFMSAFGPRRSFFVVEEAVKTKIPSDLHGVIYTTFRRRENPQLTMGSTASRLQATIQRSMANPDDSEPAKEHSLGGTSSSSPGSWTNAASSRISSSASPAEDCLPQAYSLRSSATPPPYPPFRFFRMTNSATISTRMPSRERRSRAYQSGRSTSSSSTTSAGPGGPSKPRVPTWLAVSRA